MNFSPAPTPATTAHDGESAAAKCPATAVYDAAAVSATPTTMGATAASILAPLSLLLCFVCYK